MPEPMLSFKAIIPDMKIFKGLAFQIIDDVFRPIMHKSVIRWVSATKKLTPVDTGRLRAGVDSDIEGGLAGATGALIGIVGTNVDYARPVEEGSKAHFPPVKALKGWSRRVLGNADLAFVIARSISKKPRIGVHMFRKGFEQVKPGIVRDFQSGLREVVDQLKRP